jgi:hypothetical protein
MGCRHRRDKICNLCQRRFSHSQMAHGAVGETCRQWRYMPPSFQTEGYSTLPAPAITLRTRTGRLKQESLTRTTARSQSNVSMSEDLFCAGQAPLPNGNILLAGGTLRYDIAPDNCNGKWHGLSSAYEFDWSSGSLTRVALMMHGRWYPMCVTLPDGKVMVTAGYDEYGDDNRIVEIYDSSSKSWTIRQAPKAAAALISSATARRPPAMAQGSSHTAVHQRTCSCTRGCI